MSLTKKDLEEALLEERKHTQKLLDDHRDKLVNFIKLSSTPFLDNLSESLETNIF